MTGTLAQKLARAVELGRKLQAIHRDHNLHHLSRRAWRQQTLALGGFATVEALEACRRMIREKCPALAAEVEIRAELWRRSAQDRPATFRFADGIRWPAVYAEMLAAQISDDQAAAIAAWRCYEQRSEDSFGTLEHFGQLEATLEAPRRELEELDRSLGLFPLRMMSWSGDKATVRHASFELVLDAGNVDCIASALAELVQRHVPVLVDEVA